MYRRVVVMHDQTHANVLPSSRLVHRLCCVCDCAIVCDCDCVIVLYTPPYMCCTYRYSICISLYLNSVYNITSHE